MNNNEISDVQTLHVAVNCFGTQFDQFLITFALILQMYCYFCL